MSHVPQFTYGDRLHRARRDTRLGQREFAASIGMHPATYAGHERADRLPRNARLVANSVQLVYGVPAEWILTGTLPHLDSNQEPADFALSARVIRLADRRPNSRFLVPAA